MKQNVSPALNPDWSGSTKQTAFYSPLCLVPAIGTIIIAVRNFAIYTLCATGNPHTRASEIFLKISPSRNLG